MIRQRRSQCFEVSDVAGQDRLREAYREGDQMGIDNVGSPQPGKNAAHGHTIVEWMDDDRVEELCEAGLPCTVAPCLERRPGVLSRAGRHDVAVRNS